MEFMFEDYIDAVAAVHRGEQNVAYCIVHSTQRDEHEAISIENLGGSVPSTTIIMAGDWYKCYDKIAERILAM